MADITVARDPGEQEGRVLALAVKASTKLVAGAAVSTDSNGLLKNASDTASEVFAGIMDKTVDNSTGAAGAKKGRVIRRGVFDFACASATQAWVGQKVYAVDNQTVALAATTTNDILVGRVVDFISATKVRVEITPAV